MTPTIKSTEFLTALIPILAGVGLMVMGLIYKDREMVSTGLISLLGGQGTYALSRGIAKFGTAPASTTPEAPPAPATPTDAANVVAKLP